jgi:hypothetical protein
MVLFSKIFNSADEEGMLMIRDYTICVGTVGQGVWQSPDGGNSWNRIRTPFPLESQVRALAVHPQDPQTIFAGSNNSI